MSEFDLSSEKLYRCNFLEDDLKATLWMTADLMMDRAGIAIIDGTKTYSWMIWWTGLLKQRRNMLSWEWEGSFPLESEGIGSLQWGTKSCGRIGKTYKE